MALNQNKIQSLHDNINSLDVQKWMQNTVVSIQKNIFDVFTENTVRVTDKKEVVTLSAWLDQLIQTIQSSITGKSDTDRVNDVPVKEAKEHITKLSTQKETLKKIEQSIDQINTPRTISLATITPTQLDASLLTQDVVADQTGVKIDVESKSKCIKADGDSHALKITDTGSGRQIEHDNIIIGRIEKVANISWKTNIFAEKIKELGIKQIHLPLSISKVIDFPAVTWTTWGISTIKKTKTWKINTEQLDTNTIPLFLPPHTPEAAVDTIDQKMEQLLKLVNMADMRMQYNNLKVRWDTLKMHMQNFNRNQDINADTPLFRSIFPALEHEVNEFKKQLTNAILDTQDKIDKVKNSGVADLAKVTQLEHELVDIKAKYETIADEFDTVHKELFARIYQKTPKQLPTHTTDEPPVDEPPTSNPWTSEKIDISAHIMDKESLVKKSIEQDVLEEYQHKYAKRRWPQRLAMYTYARWRQNNRISRRLSLSKRYNNTIETDIKRQQRVASSIGNFAYEHDLWVDAGKVTKTAIGSNDEVNTIANDYIKWWLSRDEAVQKFNDFFETNSDYQTGMTGTDIMEQLDDVAFMVAVESHLKPSGQRTDADYKAIQDTIRSFYSTHPTAKLHGIHLSNPHVVSKSEIDKLSDHILAYKSKTAVKQLNNITANVKLYKVEKDTVDLTQSKLREQNRTWVDKVFALGSAATFGMGWMIVGNPLWRWAIKALTWLSIAATWGGTLWIIGWVAGTAAVLQWVKTYRDYLTEAQKTHEDAMTMGTQELDKRIKELEWQIKKHHGWQKLLSIWGFGNHAIRTKQLNILKAVNEKMHRTGAIKPALTLIQDMQDAKKEKQAIAIADTLARLKIGRELNTNFISGTNRGLTEQERKDLLIQLREAGAIWAKKAWYAHLVPERNAPVNQWRDFWPNLLAIPQNGIGSLYEKRCVELKKNFHWMEDDINKGRKLMAWRDAGTNFLTSSTILGVTAAVGALIPNGGSWSTEVWGSNFQWPHNQYDLGKYDETLSPGSVLNKAKGRENNINDGDIIKFQWEAAVDAVNASTWTFGNISKEIADVTKIAWSFDSTTQAAVNNALTTELTKVKAEAIKAWADAGNVALTQQRWVDGVEEMLTKLQAAGKTGVTIQEIKFDPSTFDPIDIQASVAAWSGVGMENVIDRSVAFQATIDGIPGTRTKGDPLWVIWPWFSNTYAKPGDESKHDDSWSKRTKDLEKKR
jgi:hypothetical protein